MRRQLHDGLACLAKQPVPSPSRLAVLQATAISMGETVVVKTSQVTPLSYSDRSCLASRIASKMACVVSV